MHIARPLIKRHMHSRIRKGKEHPNRYIEKMGIPTQIRPKGDIIWIHAVSVGESISALSLVEKYIAQGKNVLITTTTLTSASIMEQRLPKQALHQFCPIDTPNWVDRFLDYWQPNMVLWMESELWPNTLCMLKNRGIPVFLVNARISKKTIARLKRIPSIAHTVFNYFNDIYVQDKKYIPIIKDIANITPKFMGNLKYSAPILEPDTAMLNLFKDSIKGRPVWVALSTHPEDEIFINPAIKKLHQKIPNLLTVIIPRHSHRMINIKNAVDKVTYAVRSKRENITENTDIYIADTMGEISLFLNAIDVCFIGGSTGGGYGGHNPLEPAKLNCAIVQGMDTNHFSGICNSLNTAGGQIQVHNSDDLVDAIYSLITDEEKRNTLIAGAKSVVKQNENIVDEVVYSIDEYFYM